MRNVLLAGVLAILIICPCVYADSPSVPNVGTLELVAQLPPELPPRVTGFTYDGEKFWATIYHGGGSYAILNRSTLQWTISDNDKQHKAIRDVSGRFWTPGAISFVDGKLWVAGAYGESFGSIDTRDWKIKSVFKGKQRDDDKSQTYSSMVHDGHHLWIAWHWFKYALPVSQTQLLLKIDPETGKVLKEYPLPPGSRADMTHGLTWDGSRLWHAKGNRLSAIDPATGGVMAEYILNELESPSGLAWDGESLWIVEFDGKIWRLAV